MKPYVLRALCVGAALSSAAASGHHAAAAAFTTNIIEVEGTVTEFNFTNPHVNIYFDVTNASGETTQWIATGSAANLLRRQGWTRETIQPGQYLRVTGRETRDGSPMILWSGIIELDPTNRSLVRNVQGESDYQDPAGLASAPRTLDDGRPNLSGAWTMGPARRGGRGRGGAGGGGGGPPRVGDPPPFNDIGAAMQAQYDPISDPAVNCEAPGLVRQAGFTPHPIRITQNADHVILEYEEYGGRRVVYLDGRGPESEAHTNLGHSVARYDGDALVIETTQLLGNYTSPMGNPLSDQTTTVETYRRMDEPNGGAVLAMEMVITDPGYLSVPWTLNWRKFYSPGYEFIEVDCRVPLTYREAAE